MYDMCNCKRIKEYRILAGIFVIFTYNLGFIKNSFGFFILFKMTHYKNFTKISLNSPKNFPRYRRVCRVF